MLYCPAPAPFSNDFTLAVIVAVAQLGFSTRSWDMPDDPSEKIIKLLEEIRDLTRERNGKFEEYVRNARERSDKYDETLKRNEAARDRALRQRRLFAWIVIPVFLFAVGILAFVAWWVIPQSEEKDYQEQLQQYQMIQTNLQAMPH